jgi:hypothetical protein
VALLVLRRVGLCVGAKANVVPKAFGTDRHKIELKKCAEGKNKNTEALAFGSAI